LKKKLRLIAILTLLCLLLSQTAGCAIPARAQELTDGLSRRMPKEISLDDTFYTGQMTFSLSLFQQVTKADTKNVLLSPLSIALALGMTANGANGETAQQMLSVLGGYSTEQLNAYLFSWCQEQTDAVKLANSIWYQKSPSLTVYQEFLQTNVDFYNAQLYQDAFDEKTVAAINRWVDQNTDGQITRLLDRLDPSTRMLLINALTFDAKWAQAYEKHQLYDDRFYSADGTHSTVPFMLSLEDCYLDDGKATGFLRPYKDGRYSFGALLPKDGVELTDYIQSMTAQGWKETLQNRVDTQVTVHLPQFESEYAVELNDALSAMGMPLAFGPQCDFSKMSNLDLYISRVLHKTHIRVDDKGTRAAAVTGVIEEDWAGPALTEPQVVKLDRPFVYFILDQTTNLPIFMGTVTHLS